MKAPHPPRSAGPRSPASGTPGRVRLIGGKWRGTRLDVPQAPGLRPTADRVRETLFNWLMPVLPGARVLDLFAGSGALGLEALSRGAASAVLVERDRSLATALSGTLSRLEGGKAAQVVNADALAWLATAEAGRFDLAFLDPPFSAGLWEAVLPRLVACLSPQAWLYVESPTGVAPELPPEWDLHREGHTRDVRYALYRRRPAAADTLA
ncbi:16S rRNA (guanine(966)-N(2))-methyltransferase RsmD [Lysobacter olei]